ncbi:histone-lysine N-methyltransferase MECOM-like [Saccostrea echinata]|uniref:histone-lysine N-methyltransferase MECOM-like n=1 Tax=Saccostrea echinata TaxID=191078 RepID=UPI002A83FACE|nr:histone-lysine N-methyltransferase MECOM-like [Saccostrea echinata]
MEIPGVRNIPPLRPIPTYSFNPYVIQTQSGAKPNQKETKLFQPWKSESGQSSPCKPVLAHYFHQSTTDIINYYKQHWKFLQASLSFVATTAAATSLVDQKSSYPSRPLPSEPLQSLHSSQSNLVDLQNTVIAGRKLFPCPQCRYTTDRRNNLKRHLLTMHQQSSKVLECCGIVFGTKASLREHSMIFHSHGYVCLYCGRRFCRKALLKRHLSVHNGKKDFRCHLCDYATSHKSNLERHRKVHSRQCGLDCESRSSADESSLVVSHSFAADLSSAETSDEEIDVSSD